MPLTRKTLKAMGLKSNFSPSEKTILISPEGKEIEFQSRKEAAQYLIDRNIPRSKDVLTVASAIGERKNDKKLDIGGTTPNTAHFNCPGNIGNNIFVARW